MIDARRLRWGVAVVPVVVETVHRRIVAIVQQQHVMQGRKMRLDTTAVETNVHQPTDSSLLGDGVRVLTRTMQKIATIVGHVGATLRDRRRSVTHRVWEIGRIARSKGAQRQNKLTQAYQRLFAATSRVVGQANALRRRLVPA